MSSVQLNSVKPTSFYHPDTNRTLEAVKEEKDPSSLGPTSMQKEQKNTSSSQSSISMSADPTDFAIQLQPLPILPQDAQPDLRLFLRGPCYEAYSELRESRLRNKHKEFGRMEEEIGPVPKLATPPRKQVKFQDLATTQDSDLMKDVKVPSLAESGRVRGRKVSSVVVQSVPDFSAALRKENRRPAPGTSQTPPPVKKGSSGMGDGLSAKGSKSASATEKRGVGMVARKSYASLEELRGSSVRAGNAICGGLGESRRRILGSGRL